MKILIDFTQIPLHKNGVGVYALNTFKLLLENDKSNEYVALIQDDDTDFKNFTFPRTKLIKVNAKYLRRFVVRFFFEQLFIPFYCLFNKVDIIHSLHYSFPLFSFRTKQIVTIHDLTFFLYPDVHTLIKRYYFRFFIFTATRFADEIICVSESTANDLNQLFPIIKSNIKVIHLAVTNKRLQFTKLEDEFILNKFGIDSEYILFIGTIEPRKNIKNLVRAFNEIHDVNPQIKLVIVGKKGWHYESLFDLLGEIALENKIIFTGFVTENEKFSLINKCKLFVYPSIYEGFGLPVLEAFLYNIPTVSSSISSIPEIAGDAAILINPLIVEELSSAMNTLLNDKLLRLSLVPKMEAKIKQYTWKNTADKTKKIYNSF